MFKVSVQKVYPKIHPNADKLELIVLNNRQYVVGKGLYEQGDLAVAIPKGALLTHPVFLREWGEYLNGKDGNIVGSKVFRGQESEGIVVRQDLLLEMGFDINKFELDVDISDILGITKYIPPISNELSGSVEVYTGSLVKSIEHDCKYAAVYADKFVEGEDITITPKLHGTQINVIVIPNERTIISSKGLWDQGLIFKEDVDNIYTKAWNNFNKTCLLNDVHTGCSFWQTLSEIISDDIFNHQVQIIGEVIPTIKGFSYGHTEPTMYVYSIYIDGVYTDLTLLRRLNKVNVIPLIYKGVYNPETSLNLANLLAQKETSFLDNTTLNEGVVLSNGKYFIKFKNEKFLKKHLSDETT